MTTAERNTVDYDALAAAADEKAKKFQHAKGKLTARERIELLCDEGSFVEHGRFFGGDPAAGFLGSAVATGFGTIDGRTVAIYSQDFSIRGGTLGKVEGQKITDLIDRAIAERVPCFALLDSGGAASRRVSAACRCTAASSASPARPPASSRRSPDPRPLCRRRGVLPGDDGLRHHAEGELPHVRHRPGRGQGRHR